MIIVPKVSNSEAELLLKYLTSKVVDAPVEDLALKEILLTRIKASDWIVPPAFTKISEPIKLPPEPNVQGLSFKVGLAVKLSEMPPTNILIFSIVSPSQYS